MQIGTVTPLLRMFDEEKARAFYIDYLGFTRDWEHRFEPGMPLYQQVSRGACVLHLTEHHGDCCPGAAIRVTGTTSTRCTPNWPPSHMPMHGPASKICRGTAGKCRSRIRSATVSRSCRCPTRIEKEDGNLRH